MRKTAFFSTLFIVSILMFAGCGNSSSCRVKQYGPEYMTYKGSRETFDSACRTVLYELSYKKETGENSVHYPYYGEGVSSNTDKKGTKAYQKYLETKDGDGYEYIITTIGVGKREPIVILETTNPDQLKLINALNEEFHKRGVKLK